MQCLKCKHKTICKHFSYMIENSHIGIEINNCKLYEEESKKASTHNTTSTEVSSIPTKVEKADTGFTNYKDFGKSAYSAPIINAMPVEINKVTCDRCKKEVYSTEIENCVECGRQVCMDCRVSVFDTTTGIPVSTCEKCWSGTEDPVPGENSEVSISFEEEKEVWDLKDFADKQFDTVEEEKDVKQSKQVDDKSSNRKSKKK